MKKDKRLNRIIIYVIYIAIILLLGWISYYGFRACEIEMGRSKRKALALKGVQYDIVDINYGIQLFYNETGTYPQTYSELLKKCKESPKWTNPITQCQLMLSQDDPWGNPYQFKVNKEGKVSAFSIGPDRISNTEDDIE